MPLAIAAPLEIDRGLCVVSFLSDSNILVRFTLVLRLFEALHAPPLPHVISRRHVKALHVRHCHIVSAQRGTCR